jgi:hypothetical protein
MIDVTGCSENDMLHSSPRVNPPFKNNKKPLTFQFFRKIDWQLSYEKPNHFGQEGCTPFYVGSIVSSPYHDRFFIDFIIISRRALKQSI